MIVRRAFFFGFFWVSIGDAAQVDPDFNIYEMSLPWVVKRSLSPSTEKGRTVLRNTILKKDNTIQWERILELVNLQQQAAAVSSAGDETTTAPAVPVARASEESSPPPAAATPPAAAAASTAAKRRERASANAASRTPEERERKQREFAAARQGAMRDAVGTLLGSTGGTALRGVLKDLDTLDLVWKLGSREGRPILKMGTERAVEALLSSCRWSPGGRGRRNAETSASSSTASSSTAATKQATGSKHRDIENYRPVSEACAALRSRQAKRTKAVTVFLAKLHTRRLLSRVRGVVGLVRLGLSALQIAAALLLRKTVKRVLEAAAVAVPRWRRLAPDTATAAAAGTA